MTWKVLGLLLALITTTPQQGSAQTPPNPCGLSSLEACRTTNALVRDAGFQAALGRFMGDRQAAHLWERGPVRDQVRAVLGGPPEAPALVGGLYRFTACRLHSCSEKGAVVLTPTGDIIAAAVLHSTCATAPETPRCADTMRLAVYLHPAADRPLIVGDLAHWAEDAVARLYTPAGLSRATLGGVDIVTVGDSD